LYVGIELSEKKWKLAFGASPGDNPRFRDVTAWDLKQMEEEAKRARERFKLAAETPVYSCYEAGRDGFSVHRALEEKLGWHNVVIDASGIEVTRKQRRAKSNKLDAGKLVNQLARYQRGEKKALRVVCVPSVAEEDRRRWHRELKVLKNARSEVSARVRSLLKLEGISWKGPIGGLGRILGELQNWKGERLPEVLREVLKVEVERWEELTARIEKLDRERREWMKRYHNPIWQMMVYFMKYKGIGIETAWYLTLEVFGWRKFANRRQLGSLIGLSPTPYDTGEVHREQGISKASNSQLRAVLIEMAWSWVRYQPNSELTKWWERRFSQGGKRARKIGIVALARKLVIALWKFVKYGEIPEGAEFKSVTI
jgi:transposase